MHGTARDVTYEVVKHVELLEGEEFKIAYHNGIEFESYAVSNYARIFTFNHKMIMSKRIQKNGYGSSRLSKDGKIHYIGTHRLVAFAFVDNPNFEEYNVVNHIDENPSNNHYTNLEWCNCNEFVDIFESMPKAALACNTTASSVCVGCKTGIPKKGFIFEYA